MMQEFVEAIKKTINKNLSEIHTALPGKIVSYDISTGFATVLPLVKYYTPEGEVIDYPQISGVPVLFPQSSGQNVTIAYPVKKDDGCLIIVSEQSIDRWLYGQETDTRLMFDLSNSLCIPGLFSKANKIVQQACEEDAVVIDVNGSQLVVSKDKISANVPEFVIKGNLEVRGTIKSN